MNKEKFLRKMGWSTWYSENYWVHPKTVKDKSKQDYTNYGFSLEDAVKYENGEINEGKPFSGCFLNLKF